MVFLRHIDAFFDSLGELMKRPIANGLTTLVIAVALAIPLIFIVFLANMKALTGGWEQVNQVSLYLHKSVSPTHQDELLDYLRKRNDIAYANLISPDQGMKSLEQAIGFSDLGDLLTQNPLPPLVEIHPAMSVSAPAHISLLVNELRRLPEVESAKIDMQWVERLHALVGLAEQVTDGILLLLGVAVLLVTGNTMRLAVQSRRAEIEVFKLVGATNRFIRRPFIFSGVIMGGVGAALALVLIKLLLLFVDKPVSRLAYFYHVDYHLQGLQTINLLLVLIAGLILGGVGASLAVRREISAIEPE